MTIPILLSAALWLAQQPPPLVRLASVDGTVINTLSAQGIRGATVILRSRDAAAGTNYAEETDSNGHFQIYDVAPGEYSISADHQSFFPQPNGAPGAPMPRFTVAAGEQVTHVVVKLTPTGVIAGRVLDQDGQPIRGARVQAMQYANVAGRPQLRAVVSVQSKAKGEYRLFGLHPGGFRLRVSGQATRATWMEPQTIHGPRAPIGYAATFFPSVIDAARATVVDLKPGAELSGFDITVSASEPWHSVRFKYRRSDRAGIQPQLIPVEGMGVGYGQSMRASGEAFEFTGVLPGSYILLVLRTEEGVHTYARQPVEVSDADVDAEPLVFLPAATITGAVRVEGKPSAAAENVQLFMQPEGPSQFGAVRATTKRDGSFAFNEVPPGIYQIALRGLDGLYIQSIRSGDEELSSLRLDVTRGEAGPLTIVLSAAVGKIEGPVALADGSAAARVRVTLFPEGASSEHPDLFKVAFTDDQGNFRLDKVAPGEYRLFAWLDVQPGGPQDPELRKKFEKQSARVKLAPDGDATVALIAIVTKTDEPR